MALWHRLGRSGTVAVLALLVGALGVVTYRLAPDRPAPLPVSAAAPTTQDLRNAVSVQAVSRIDKASCTTGAGGVPGPGDGGDWCYVLKPGLDLTRAARVELIPEMERPGVYSVAVTLAPADRDKFAAWTVQAAGGQIAIRVQDRVVQAPELLEPLSGDSLFVGSLPEAQARALLRQLWQ